MSVLETYYKQPGDTQDYDIDFNDYLTHHGDTHASHTAVAEAGVTIPTSSHSSGVIKVWVSGGAHGTNYKVTVTMTTSSSPARVKEAEILIKVREI